MNFFKLHLFSREARLICPLLRPKEFPKSTQGQCSDLGHMGRSVVVFRSISKTNFDAFWRLFGLCHFGRLPCNFYGFHSALVLFSLHVYYWPIAYLKILFAFIICKIFKVISLVEKVRDELVFLHRSRLYFSHICGDTEMSRWPEEDDLPSGPK